MDESIRNIRREQWLRSQNNKRKRDEISSSSSSSSTTMGVSAVSDDKATPLTIDIDNDNYTNDKKANDVLVDLTNDDDDEENDSSSVSSTASSLSLLSRSSPPHPKTPPTLKTNKKSTSPPPRRKAVRPKKDVTATKTTGEEEAVETTNKIHKKNNEKKRVKKTKNSTMTTSSSPQYFSFSICTYNIWFGPPHPSKRMEEIANLLLHQSQTKPKPLFIGLQEVTTSLAMELFPLLQSCGYHLICQELRSDEDYGCAVAVLTESIGGNKNEDERVVEIVSSGFSPFKETIMNRGFVFVHGRIASSTTSNRPQQEAVEILFLTTHLESFVQNYPSAGQTYSGKDQRESQVKQMSTFCDLYLSKNKTLMGAFVTGDLNWDDERKRSKGVDPALLDLLNGDSCGNNHSYPWMDAWRISQGEKAEGYTYDSKINAMLRGSLRRRFDRILIRKPTTSSRGCTLNVKSTNLFGMEPIPDLEWKKEVKPWGSSYASSSSSSIQIRPVLPSDHFGLWAVMDYSTSSKG